MYVKHSLLMTTAATTARICIATQQC